MRLVKLIEVFTRDAVKILVDSGEPYLSKSNKLVKGFKVDLEYARRLEGKVLTIGDVIAHSISLSNSGSVFSVFNDLIDDFAQKLKNSHPRWTEEKETWPLEPIISDVKLLKKNLNQLFQARNIIAHELPTKRPFETRDIPIWITSTKQFVDACDWILVECTKGSIARTQIQMSNDAYEKLKSNRKRLEDALIQLRQLSGVDQKLIDVGQQHWKDYSDKMTELVASQVLKGSMYPMMLANAEREMIEDRISQIERVVRDWFD